MREGDQRWLVLWGLGMERPREGKVGACGSGRWTCSVAVGKEMGVEKKRISKQGRVAMERLVEKGKSVLWPAGKIKTRGGLFGLSLAKIWCWLRGCVQGG
ncbi:hypothetical protein BDE02_19G030200 [Populus trichocarpa]|jgi:hypothetical protein|nr:hypothetical protein BDE02_19G030200 [Populus trichocarpa]